MFKKEKNFEELEKVRAKCGKVQDEITEIRERVAKLNNEVRLIVCLKNEYVTVGIEHPLVLNPTS